MAMIDARQTPSETPHAVEAVRINRLSPLVIMLAIFLAGIAAWWGLVTWFAPASFSIEVFGKELTFSRVHEKLLGGTILGSWMLLACVFLGELVLVGWQNSSARHLSTNVTKSGWTDLGMFVFETFKINYVIMIVLTVGIGLFSGEWLRERVEGWTGLQFGISDWPLLSQLAMLYIVYTFLDYWLHRVEHMPVFWPIHRFHHSAEDFYILTANRVHPADIAGLFMLVMPLQFLGASEQAMLLIYITTGFIRFVVHSRIPSNFGWVGRWLVQSPLDHRMHHILDMSQGQGGHYALLPFWDRIFGTWRGGGHPELAIGVDDRQYRHGAWALPDLLHDYWDFVKNVGAVFGLNRPANTQSVMEYSTLHAANDAAPATPSNEPNTPRELRTNASRD